jgi:vitamin B12 transporter
MRKSALLCHVIHAPSLGAPQAEQKFFVSFFQKRNPSFPSTARSLGRLVLLCLFPATALAQTAGDPEQVLVTATRTPVPVADVAAGVTVIDRATIEQRGYTDLVQALSAVPGLRVAQSGGPGAEASVFVRGTNSNQVLVLRNGVPVNDPGDPGGLFDFGVDSLNDIERIEIVRGPMSSLYGSGAIGGVINLITRKGTGGLHGDVTLAGGTNTTGLARGSVGGSSGIWDFAANAEGFSTRGFDQTPPRERAVDTGEADGDREQLGSLEIGVTPVEGTRISLGLRGRDAKYGYDEQGAVTYDGGNATGQDSTFSGRLGVVSHLLGDAWTTSLSLSRVQDDRHYTVTQDALDPNDDTEDDHYHGRRTDVQWNNSYNLPDYAIADRNTLTWGYGHTNDTADTRIDSVSFGSPYQSLTRAHDDTDAGYAGAQTRLWKLLTLNGQLREDATTEAGNAFTWRLGGVLELPWLSSRLKASYGTGFRAPALFDRFGTDSFGYRGNPDLRPERSEGWEAGISTDLPVPAALGAATVSVTYFSNRIRDLIELAFTPVYTSVNIDSARTQGIEAGLSLQMRKWLQADLAYTYTDARDLQTGAALLRRPRNQGSVDLRMTPIPAVSIVPELVYTGAFEDFLVDDNGAGLGTGLARSGLIFNLNTDWAVTPHITLFAWGKNLANSHFEPVSGYITPGPSGLFGAKVTF